MSDMKTDLINLQSNLMNASSFADRLKYLMRLKGITGQELAEAINISKANVSTLVTGKVTNPPATTVLEMARIFQVDPEWLTFGTGSPVRKTFDPEEENSPPADGISRALKINLKEYGYSPVKSLSYYRGRFEVVSNKIMERFNLNPDDCTVYTNSGDEMAPVLQNGDSVLVHNFNGQICNGKIYALAINDHQTFCRYLYKMVTSESIIMQCEKNDCYPEEMFVMNESPIRLLGRVVTILNRELK